MKIFAIDKLLPGVTMTDSAPRLADEARVAWELYKDGLIREMHFRQDKSV